MGRKYINRIKRDSSDVSADDEWAHITNNVEEPSPEIEDTMDDQHRSIAFSKNEVPKSTIEKVKEGTLNVRKAAGKTDQYIKFVNEHIDNQKKEIDKIKIIKEKFDQEVKLLQVHKPNLIKLDADSLEKYDMKTVSKYLNQLLQEKESAKKKLNNLKVVIENVEVELQNQENQIEGLHEELKSKQLEKHTDRKDSVAINTELNSLVEKFGIDNLSDVFDMIKTIKSPTAEK